MPSAVMNSTPTAYRALRAKSAVMPRASLNWMLAAAITANMCLWLVVALFGVKAF